MLTLEMLDLLEREANEAKPIFKTDILSLIAMARASLADREDALRWRWAVANQDELACFLTFYTPRGLTGVVDAARTQPPKD